MSCKGLEIIMSEFCDTKNTDSSEGSKQDVSDEVNTQENNAYKDWRLSEVLSLHRLRLQDFFLRKGVFSSSERAYLFDAYVEEACRLSLSPEVQRDYLRSAFRESFPEAPDYGKGDVARTRDVGEQMLQTLTGEGYTVEFPTISDRPTSFIDVGCGIGETTSALAKYWDLSPDRAVGLDIFQPPSTPGNILFEQMQADELPAHILPMSQDLAIVSMVLHHSPNPESLVSQIFKVLKPGAYLVVREHDATPELTNFLDSVHVFYEQVFPDEPIFVPNAKQYKQLEEWQSIIENHGFDTLKIDYKPYPENPNNTSNNLTFVFQKPVLTT
jgi:ubiquinone/menaquinone biosynthesis C-methylase UbiE